MRLIAPLGLLALAACSAPSPPAPASAGSPQDRATLADAVPGDAAPAMAAPAAARLQGRVAYPSEELPAMRVCALATDDPGTAHCVGTAVNQAHYDLALPAGEWWLLAWPLDTGTAGDPGLYSAASECLGSGGLGCDDHALQPVRVAAGEVVEGLDINDWYYDPREFPPPMAPAGD